MTIPKFHELFNKVLEDLSDGQEWRAKDFYEHVIDSLNLPEAERSEKLGGGSNRAISRAYFACEYLFQARAISRPKRGHVQITDFGRQMLEKHPQGITVAFLNPQSTVELSSLVKFGHRGIADRRGGDTFGNHLTRGRVEPHFRRGVLLVRAGSRRVVRGRPHCRVVQV